ncbi:MAG: 50S ribosomal protein L11 methyltransferase, partial [Alistipes sp.]|nr:50S ribosomal protein L11 methyltransferase [Alistipes sp.]
ENIASNGVADRIEPMLGDVRRIAGRHYGFILANINRNILTADMPAYAAALEPGGDLVMSGFLEQDVPAIVACAGELGLRPVATAAREGWMMVHVRKG